MAKVLDSITPELARWIARQPVFFVATAPLDAGGHVNLSPKGHDTFRVTGERSAAYLDLTGSGVETIAHLRENGRITVMFCAFAGPPRIARLHGRGTVVRPGDDGFDGLAALFPTLPGTRSVVTIDVERVSTSCGYAVPRMDLVGDRDNLIAWAERKRTAGVEAYWGERNATSIDGLAGIAT